jgi:hypothetical protein
MSYEVVTLFLHFLCGRRSIFARSGCRHLLNRTTHSFLMRESGQSLLRVFVAIDHPESSMLYMCLHLIDLRS